MSNERTKKHKSNKSLRRLFSSPTQAFSRFSRPDRGRACAEFWFGACFRRGSRLSDTWSCSKSCTSSIACRCAACCGKTGCRWSRASGFRFSLTCWTQRAANFRRKLRRRWKKKLNRQYEGMNVRLVVNLFQKEFHRIGQLSLFFYYFAKQLSGRNTICWNRPISLQLKGQTSCCAVCVLNWSAGCREVQWSTEHQ